MQDTKAWYKSKGVNGGILVLVTVLTMFFDIEITTEEVQQVVEYFGLGIGGALALWGRIVADKKIGSG